MLLYFLVTLVLLSSGLLMGLLALLYRSPWGRARRIREAPAKIDDAQFRRNVASNSLLALVLCYASTYVVDVLVLDSAAVSLRQWFGQTVAILMLFDFSYYWTHRYPFHKWSVLRRVHAVHHRVRSPNAMDSLYLHPIEGVLGLTLFFASVLVIGYVLGSVNIYAFAAALWVYSVLNIIVHCGLDLKAFPLSIISFLARRHDEHHRHMRAKNYASVSPLPDLLFGTRESSRRRQ